STNRNGGCCHSQNPVCCSNTEGCCSTNQPQCCTDSNSCCGKSDACCSAKLGGGCCPANAPVCCTGSGNGKYCCQTGYTCCAEGCCPPAALAAADASPTPGLPRSSSMDQAPHH
ncbi:MAG: hypothetical protein ACR2J8_03380, partial [Thermomicrobiales bacterium]